MTIESHHSVAQQRVLGPEAFGFTGVVGESGRARSFEDTWAWVKPVLRRVPITRLVDATPIDFVDLPVWSAITPLARDLTVHAGKGSTPLASRLSAVMEAIERVCAEAVAPERVIQASYRTIRDGLEGWEVLDPEEFDLPFQTRYSVDLPISWIGAWDLVSQRKVWVALDLVLSPPTDGVCVGVETNGLASGNTYTEATLHALYEVVERDAISHGVFFDRMGDPTDALDPGVRMIDVSSLPPESLSWVQQLCRRGLEVLVRDLSTETGIPVFQAIVLDPTCASNDGSAASFGGYGASLHARKAIFRAISEAVQCHTIVSLGARDTFEGRRIIAERCATQVRKLNLFKPQHTAPFVDTGAAGPYDLRQDLDTVLLRLTDAGYRRCLVIDLAREDLEVPVVRVLVPEMAPMYGSTTRRPGTRLLRRLLL